MTTISTGPNNFDALLTPASSPSINAAPVLTSPDYLNQLSNAPVSLTGIIETQSLYQSALSDAQTALALQDTAVDTEFTNLGNGVIRLLNGQVLILTQSAGVYSLIPYSETQVNGPLLGTDLNKIDPSEMADYQTRYIQIDAPNYNSDNADLSFMRIVENTPSQDNVFPRPSAGWLQPGITETKFKQFILLQLGEASKERMQIVETSQDFQVLFFNKKPEFLSISGILKNTIDNPWNVNMVFLWDNLMRGTKLVENGWILQFYADGQLYYGYPFEFNRSKIAPNDFTVQFGLTFIVTDRINLYNTDSTLTQSAQTVKTA